MTGEDPSVTGDAVTDVTDAESLPRDQLFRNDQVIHILSDVRKGERHALRALSQPVSVADGNERDVPVAVGTVRAACPTAEQDGGASVRPSVQRFLDGPADFGER